MTLQQKKRTKQKYKGNAERYRLAVFKSNRNIYAQIIDDERQVTVAAASSIKFKNGGNKDAAEKVGKEIAILGKKANVKLVFLDRRNKRYLGRIEIFSIAARKEGLVF